MVARWYRRTKAETKGMHVLHLGEKVIKPQPLNEAGGSG
jgi:hypothetical protein